jgi:hypothetical protein
MRLSSTEKPQPGKYQNRHPAVGSAIHLHSTRGWRLGTVEAILPTESKGHAGDEQRSSTTGLTRVAADRLTTNVCGENALGYPTENTRTGYPVAAAHSDHYRPYGGHVSEGSDRG